ncbi:hypothetical protein CGCVW01_v001268 [Colletotrichum viniferum]|nr:hypothetical protein CGCVW01_v001268 [Colletotrichum viniferum]
MSPASRPNDIHHPSQALRATAQAACDALPLDDGENSHKLPSGQDPRPARLFSSTLSSLPDSIVTSKPGTPDTAPPAAKGSAQERSQTPSYARSSPITVFLPAGEVTMNLPWGIFKSMQAETYDRILRLPVSSGMGFAKLHLQTEEGSGLVEPPLDVADTPMCVQTCTFHPSRTPGVSVLNMPKPNTQTQEAVDIKTSPRRGAPRVPVGASRQPRAPSVQADMADPFSYQPLPDTITSYFAGIYDQAGVTGDSWLTNPALIADSKDGVATIVKSPAPFSCPGMYLQRSSSVTINVVFRGGPKVWLIVKPTSSRRLEDCWDVTYCVFSCVEGDAVVVPPGTYFQVFNAEPCLSQLVTIPSAPTSDASSPHTGDLRPCGDTCKTLQPPGSAWPDDSAANTVGDKVASSDCDPAEGPGRRKLPESQTKDHQDIVGSSGPSAGGPADVPLVRRRLRKAVPPSPPSSGNNAGEGPTLGGRPAPPSSSSSQPLARHQLRGTATSDRASTIRREGHLNGKTSTGKRAQATNPTDDDNTLASTSRAHATAQRASKRTCPAHNPILVSPQTSTRPRDPPAAPRDRPHNGYSKSHARDVASSDETDDTDDTDYENDDEDVEDLDCDISRDDTPDSLAETSAEDCSGNQDDADNQKPRSGEARPHTSGSAPSVDKVEAIVKSLVTRGVEQCVALLQAWRAASTSSTLHLPPCENRVVLYRNTQQAKYHEALARYRTRLAHIQLSRRLKKPGPDSIAVYRSRSDIQSLTCEVLGINPSSANTKSRAYCLQRADISRCLYTGRILDIVSGDGLDFLPALPPGKLSLTLSDSQDLARRLVSLASEDDGGSAVKQLAAFGRLFARVVQGEQADPLFGLDVESVAHLASTAEAPQPPRPPISGPERIATHAWGLGDKLRVSIGRLTGPGQDVSLPRMGGCAICTHRHGPDPLQWRECAFQRHIDLPHPYVRISYTGTPASMMMPRLQAVRHPDVPVLGPLGSPSSPATNPDQVSITAGDIVSVVPGELILDSSSAASELTPASRWGDIGDEVRVAPGVVLRIDKANPFLQMLMAPPSGSQSSELEAKVLSISAVSLLVLVAVSDVKNGDTLCLR